MFVAACFRCTMWIAIGQTPTTGINHLGKCHRRDRLNWAKAGRNDSLPLVNHRRGGIQCCCARPAAASGAARGGIEYYQPSKNCSPPKGYTVIDGCR